MELFRSEEEIVGGIGDAEFLTGMSRIATGRGSLSAFRVQALDGRDTGEYALSAMVHDGHQQPGNRIRVRRRCICGCLALDAATITSFPGRPGELLAERFPVFVEELRIGSLQRPGKLGSTFLADVDLITLGVDVGHELFIGGRLQFLRGTLGVRGRGEREVRKEKQQGVPELLNTHTPGGFLPE